jgi:hypothetical protein
VNGYLGETCDTRNLVAIPCRNAIVFEEKGIAPLKRHALGFQEKVQGGV